MDLFASVKFPKCLSAGGGAATLRLRGSGGGDVCRRAVASNMARNICVWQEMETNLLEDFQRSTYNNGFICIRKVSKVPLFRDS